MWPQIATVLTGTRVTLEPLRPEHANGLRHAAADDRIWTFMITTDVERWLEDAYTEHAAGTRGQFGARRGGTVVGSTSYLSLAPEHLRLEVGNTWMHPSTWGTGANTEAKYLLLRHAFETLGWRRLASDTRAGRRVEFKTAATNARARAALAALPAECEGIHRKHMVVRGEKRR